MLSGLSCGGIGRSSLLLVETMEVPLGELVALVAGFAMAVGGTGGLRSMVVGWGEVQRERAADWANIWHWQEVAWTPTGHSSCSDAGVGRWQYMPWDGSCLQRERRADWWPWD